MELNIGDLEEKKLTELYQLAKKYRTLGTVILPLIAYKQHTAANPKLPTIEEISHV